MKLEKITRDFIKTLTEPQKKRTAAYDSKGIVTRIEEGIAWVKLAGSKIETPLQMTIRILHCLRQAGVERSGRKIPVSPSTKARL